MLRARVAHIQTDTDSDSDTASATATDLNTYIRNT